MKLLFNTENASVGNEEVKSILGFTDADLKIKNLKPYIITATDEIIKVIGSNMYDVLIGIYEASSSSDTDTEFLHRCQYAILLDASRNYFIDSDLNYTNQGRVNRLGDNEKIAFEWQIYRSNRNAERKYYKAFDALINFMDEKVSGWKNTEAFKATNDLFVRNVAQFEDYFFIDGSRLLFQKLVPAMRKAEDEEITARITQASFDELKEKLKNSATDYDKKLLSLIREAVVYTAMSWGVVRLSVQLFPEGLLTIADSSRMTTSAKKTAEKTNAEALSGRFEKDAAEALKKLEDYLESINAQNQPIVPDIDFEKPFHDPNDKFVNC